MKFSLSCIRINQGGYDDSGYYWGRGEPLYRYEQTDSKENEHTHNDYIRAEDREDAKAQILARHPDATFYR